MIALVLAMVWSRRGQAATLALLSLFGVAAAVAAPAYLRAADRAIAAGQVATAAPAERGLSLVTRELDQRGAPPADQFGPNPAAPSGDVSLEGTGSALVDLPGFDYVHSAEYPTVGIEPDDTVRTRFVYRQDVCAHVTMTAGRCLIGEADILLGDRTAARLKLSPGDAITLTYATFVPPPERTFAPAGRPKRFLVAGTYRADRPADPFWGGHNYFGPDTGDRPGEPVFVTHASYLAMDKGNIELGVDGYAEPGALGVDRLPAVRAGLTALQGTVTALGPGIELQTRIPDLLARIDAGRRDAHAIVPVLAVCLVLLSCLTIFLAVGYGTEGRRPELAVVALRGARWGQRWWLATGENLVAIVAGAIAGCLAGQLLVNAFAAWRFPGVGADPGLDSLRWAPVAALAAVLTAVLAERRQLTTPVAELLRRAPAVPGSAGAIAAEAFVVLLAVAAAVQLSITGGALAGVGTFATGLVLLAAALVAARLLLPWATLFARRSLRRGRIGPALAAFQLSRRPGAVRLFALLTASVAVAGYAACAVDVAAVGRTDQAVLGTGATRVLSVGPVGRSGLLAAVRAVDPDGRFAMAAVRVAAERDEPAVLAVDTTRLAAVANWPDDGPDPATTARALRPAAGEPLTLTGERVAFDITSAGFARNKAVELTVVLSPVAGRADELFRLGVLRPGRHTYAQDVPACAAGCTVNSIRIAGGQGSLDVAGQITVHRIGGLDGAATDPARWRATEGGTLAAAADGLRIDVGSLNGLPSGMFVLPADAPFPLPVATAGITALPGIGGLDGRTLPVTVAGRLPAVPGLGAPAVLADLTYADRLATDGATTSSGQVWLAAGAPADAPQQLAARGLVITADTRASDVRDRLDEQGPALALWFYVIVAVLATALAAGALVLAAGVDRARRIEDLSALRGQGLTRGAVRQATLVTYPVLVGLAVVAGLAIALLGWKLTGWALPLAGEGATALPLPGHPRVLVLAGTGLAVFTVLAGVALAAGRRTLREIS